MRRAFAYLRATGKGKVGGDGFPAQLEAIRRYASQRDIRIAKVFREEGGGGTKKLRDRPALVALMEALHGDGVRLVLVERLDRLARGPMLQESILHDLKLHGFELASVSEPELCSDDPGRKLMRRIMGAFAEYRQAMASVKLRAARRRARAKSGRCEGAKPFGHFDGEERALERMRALRAGGMAYDKIAAALNDEGFPTRHGKRWHPFSVSKILAREREE